MGVTRWVLGIVVAGVVASPGVAGADCFGPLPGQEPTPKKPTDGLRFGMYPGGVAGQLGPTPAAPKPDIPAKQLAALADLSPDDGPFVVHLYLSYPDNGGDAKQVERYTSAGYDVEFVVRYRKDDDVAGYTKFLRGIVDRFGSSPHVTGIQVANEVNFTASPDSSDGAYAGAKDALIQGVIAAKGEARTRGYDQLEIGFNWIYRLDPKSEQDFWGYLRDHGGPEFVKSLDWLGLDAYPGTFFPPAANPPEMRTAMIDAMDELRCNAKSANIPKTVPIHVAENGYPTGSGARTYDMQKDALETMVGTVADYRGSYNVTDYRWFDLRDADSSSPNFQQQYGLMTDDYTPKPAYASWKRLIGKLTVRYASVGNPPVRGAPRLGLRVRCYWRGVRARVHGPDAGRVRRVVLRARGTRLVDRRAPFRRTIRLRPRARVRGVRVTARATTRDGDVVTLVRRRSPSCVRARPAGPA